MVICVFGDSTAWGAWDKDKGGWVNRLWLHMSQNSQEHDLYNLSISGGTSRTILQQFENEAKVREADIVIFQTGGNDAAYEGVPNNYLVPPDEFENNVQTIIDRAAAMAKKIIFIGFNIVDEIKTMPVPWVDVYYTNANIRTYNEIVTKICAKNTIPYLDTFDLLQKEDLADGLHPNEIGHEKIFQKVKDALISNSLLTKE